MIELQNLSEFNRSETLRKIRAGKYQRGTKFEYHVGAYPDLIGMTELGRSVYALRDVARLFQVKLADEPRVYSYQLVVK